MKPALLVACTVVSLSIFYSNQRKNSTLHLNNHKKTIEVINEGTGLK